MTSSWQVTGSTFTSNSASTSGGAIHYDPGNGTTDLDISDTSFINNTAGTNGGAVYLEAVDDITLRDVILWGNEADNGGGVYFKTLVSLIVERADFCDNEAISGSGGGAYLEVVDTGGGASPFTNSLFRENIASVNGGGAYVKDGKIDFTNNSFLYNIAVNGGGVLIDGTTTSIINNLLAWNDEYGMDTLSLAGGSSDYNAWYLNVTGHLAPGSRALGSNSLSSPTLTDPLLTAYSANANCADDQPWPAVGSPLIDAGDPDPGTTTSTAPGTTSAPMVACRRTCSTATAMACSTSWTATTGIRWSTPVPLRSSPMASTRTATAGTPATQTATPMATAMMAAASSRLPICRALTLASRRPTPTATTSIPRATGSSPRSPAI